MVYVLGIEVVKQYEHVKSELAKSVKSEQVKSVNVFVFNKPNHFRIKEKSSKAEYEHLKSNRNLDNTGGGVRRHR